MKYFRQIKTGVPTRPFLAELGALSNVVGARSHAGVREAVPLRSLRTSSARERAPRDVHDSRWTSAAPRLRIVTNFLKDFSQERDVDLGRARLLRLPARHHIPPRFQRGDYHLFRDRYHLILKAPAGVWLHSGDEQVVMREGELWWFNNKATHEVRNDNSVDCILLAFDALNADGRRLLAQAVRIRASREGLQAPALF